MEAFWVLEYFLLLLSLLFLTQIWKKIGHSSNKLPPIPSPPKLPIIGNLHQLGPLLHRSLHQLSTKHGAPDVMLLQLGRVPALIVSSAAKAKEILQTYDLDCCSRPLTTGTKKLSYNYLDLAFCPYGDYWREMRKICVVELFSVKRVQSFRPIREEEVGLMIESISQSNNVPINLSLKLLSLISEVICRVAFGSSSTLRGGDGDDIDGEKILIDVEKFQKLVHEAMKILGSFSAFDFFPNYFGWIIDRVTGYHGKLDRLFHELDLLYQKVIDDHSNYGEHEDARDLIEVLQKIKQNQIQMTDDNIKAILLGVFLAGVESGVSLVEWVMAELIVNPRVMKKAQEEIRNFIGNKGKVSESDIEHLEYLKLVVKEALRMHPSTGILTRESRSQFKINGYNVDPKTHIYINIWAIGRDPKSWENPNQFYPERFINSSLDFKGQHFEYLPFGAGRRSCPGMNMGLASVELALANLLYHFDWKLPNGLKKEDVNMEEAPGISNYKKESLQLIPTKYVFSNN